MVDNKSHTIQVSGTVGAIVYGRTVVAREKCRHSKYKFVSVFALLQSILIYFSPFDYSFVSTLLTAVLTHHLGWVETLNYNDSVENSTETKLRKLNLTECRPYDALWAQLTDLYGVLGFPMKSSKTVVCGAKTKLISKILNILTYFIRCGEVKRNNSDKIVEERIIKEIFDCKRRNEKNTKQNNDVRPLGMTKSKTVGMNLALIQQELVNDEYSEGMKNNNASNDSWRDAEENKDTESNKNEIVGDLETAEDALDVIFLESKNNASNCDKSNPKKFLSETIESKCLNENKKIGNDDTASTNNNGVIFMLGESDVLTNLKKPSDSTSIENEAKESENATKPVEKKCSHKKHSGVKFNFERYPQIVTNYMRNKNLDIDSYDFLEKGLKMEQEENGACSNSLLPMIVPEESDEDEEECECCANTFRVLQTPSNATELEFSNEDNYPIPKPAEVSVTSTPSYGTTTEHECLSKPNAFRSVEIDQNQNKIERKKRKSKLKLIRVPIPKSIAVDK